MVRNARGGADMAMTPIRQEQILTALETYPAFFLSDLAGDRVEYVALHRAAQTLQRQGKLEFWKHLAGGTNSTWVSRPGYRCHHYEVPRINERSNSKGDTGHWRMAKC
jgi:hypothetical protein